MGDVLGVILEVIRERSLFASFDRGGADLRRIFLRGTGLFEGFFGGISKRRLRGERNGRGDEDFRCTFGSGCLCDSVSFVTFCVYFCLLGVFSSGV